MKKVFLLLMMSIAAFSLTGCSTITLNEYSMDIEKMELVQTIGVDDSDNEIMATAQLLEGQAKPVVISAKSKSVVGALKELLQYSAKERIFFSHTKHYILGESAAQQGVGQYLDFIERDMNMRLNTPVFIAKGGSAKDLICTTANQDLDISQILENTELTSQILSDSYIFNCGQIAQNLLENGCSLVAAVEIQNAQENTSGGIMAVPAGYAVLKDGKLVHYISKDIIGGVNVFMEKMNADILDITGADGRIAFKVDRKKCKVTPVFDGDRLTDLNILITLDATIDEVGGDIDIYSKEVINRYSDNISNKIGSMVREVIDVSQNLGTDFLNLSQRVSLVEPTKYAKMAESFNDVYGKLSINVDVKTKIERTYDLMEPVGVSDQ